MDEKQRGPEKKFLLGLVPFDLRQVPLLNLDNLYVR